eukprot:SAG31_NODE_692_length_12772_cov_15.543044_5_plen_59_part_00
MMPPRLLVAVGLLVHCARAQQRCDFHVIGDIITQVNPNSSQLFAIDPNSSELIRIDPN